MKILVLCTGNSCRSIIAEAILKSLGHEAKSAGSKPTGKVNENAKKLLQSKGLWSDEFYSKPIEAVLDEDFDLVLTVCDNAKEACPVFGKKTKMLHIPFEDPDGQPYETFEALFEIMKKRLTEAIDRFKIQKQVLQTASGVKISFKNAPLQTIQTVVQNCQKGKCECMSDETKKKIKNMQIEAKEDGVELTIKGDIAKEEIEAALKRSKLLK